MFCLKGSKLDFNYVLWKWNFGGLVVCDFLDFLKLKILNKKLVFMLKLSVNKVLKFKCKWMKLLVNKNLLLFWCVFVDNDIMSVFFLVDLVKESVLNIMEIEIVYC